MLTLNGSLTKYVEGCHDEVLCQQLGQSGLLARTTRKNPDHQSAHKMAQRSRNEESEQRHLERLRINLQSGKKSGEERGVFPDGEWHIGDMVRNDVLKETQCR